MKINRRMERISNLLWTAILNLEGKTTNEEIIEVIYTIRLMYYCGEESRRFRQRSVSALLCQASELIAETDTGLAIVVRWVMQMLAADGID